MPRLFGSEDRRAILQFLGRRFLVFASVSVVAAILGGVIDYAFAIAIQLFIFTMGLTAAFAPPFSLPGLDRPLAVGALLISLGALRAAFLFLQGFGAGLAQEHASSRIRQSAILGILPAGDNHDRVTSAEAIFAYSEISGKAAVYLLNLIRFVAAGVQTVILAAAMLYLSWMDCLIAAGLLLLAGGVLLRLNVRIGHVAKLNPQIWSDSVSALESAGRNWFYLRIKHLHDVERARLYGLNRNVQAIGFRLRRLSEISPAAVNVLAIVILAVLTNTRAAVTHTAPTVFLSFLYVFMRFAQGLGEAARDASALVEYKPYLERLRALVRSRHADSGAPDEGIDRGVTIWGVSRPATPEPVPAALPPPERPTGLRSPRVTLRDVSFRYDETGPFILRQLDSDVPAGSQLAIIGPSGCGKSTLLSLILGFLKPAGGAIDIEGMPPEQFCSRFSEYIGYVGPEPYIVSGTLRDNVVFGSHGRYADEQIWRALAQAALTDVVTALPAGLDTPLRHHDVQLSMGQRQRLALARALLPEPVLLILDEASANLDDATEDAIASSIRSLKGTTTTIIVSHKLGLVKYADRVVDLAAENQGKARDSRSAP